tara:strand:+ start:405 stop:1289 length:885 start_codon:yes stop_codon:yes gene_type:complete
MKKNNVYILEDRGILYIQGEDCLDYLQNIITNDIKKVNDSMSCFASLLTPQGKYLFDFIIVKHKKGYLIDCEKKQIEKLYKQFQIYKLRSKVEILNLSNEFVIAAISKDKFLSFENSEDKEGFTIKYREDPIVLDPRNKKLGGRLIINLEKLYLSIKKLDLKSSELNEYYDLSFKLGVSQLNTDKLQNKLFGIECNFEELNGLDFKKGCYVGQENTARIKLKNKLSKKLLPIEILSGSIKIDDDILENKKVLGKILIDEKYPFGLLKFKDESFNFDKKFTCGKALIKVLKPDWL